MIRDFYIIEAEGVGRPPQGFYSGETGWPINPVYPEET
jgi:hypothetical protein